jgi:hypothetical protein
LKLDGAPRCARCGVAAGGNQRRDALRVVGPAEDRKVKRAAAFRAHSIGWHVALQQEIQGVHVLPGGLLSREAQGVDALGLQPRARLQQQLKHGCAGMCSSKVQRKAIRLRTALQDQLHAFELAKPARPGQRLLQPIPAAAPARRGPGKCVRLPWVPPRAQARRRRGGKCTLALSVGV